MRKIGENIGFLCGDQELEELSYRETINDYLNSVEPSDLQKIILEGTQLLSSREELPGYYLYRTHNHPQRA